MINALKKEAIRINERKKSQPLISLQQVYKSFGATQVLRGIDLELFEGENLVIIGKSGSGKSVLLKCIVRLLEADSGNISVLGQDMLEVDQYTLDRLRAQIGFLFQGSALYDSMTVKENLLFPLRRHPERLFGEDEDDLVYDALDSVGLAHTIDLMPEELSGGMKRRVALARTLILRPKIILYDEPTSGLDPITAKEIMELILEIQRTRHAAAVIITHDMYCAQMVANRVVMLIDGRNYAEGTFDELSRSRDPRVRAFFK
ncbi:MAG: ATP-binding cassette domain-containing protein [Lewinella sp.]|nr:ATP-binding cassette domain-containing protein [Lewinella sp.]